MSRLSPVPRSGPGFPTMIGEDQSPRVLSPAGIDSSLSWKRRRRTTMADILTGSIQNGVIVLDTVPGRPLPPDGTRVRIEITGLSTAHDWEPDPLTRTRAFLL